MNWFRELFGKKEPSTSTKVQDTVASAKVQSPGNIQQSIGASKDDRMSNDPARKFELGIQANIADDLETAFKLFKECYDNGYNAADSAGVLGLISFQHYTDIEQTQHWFTVAAKLGTEDAFPYLAQLERSCDMTH